MALASKVWVDRYLVTSLWTIASVTLVGGAVVSNMSAVPPARFVSAMVPLMPLYCVMVLYSPVVPNWLRNACSVVAYVWSAEAALAKFGPQKTKTTLAEVITPPPWLEMLVSLPGTRFATRFVGM